MNLICAICYDPLEDSSKDVSATPCGHVFHHGCLIEWIQRAFNCPECRQHVGSDELRRIHLNFEEYSLIQTKVAILGSQLDLKECELTKARDEYIALISRNNVLLARIEKTEKKIDENKSAIYDLTEEHSENVKNLRSKIKNHEDELKKSCSEKDELQKEVKDIREKLKETEASIREKNSYINTLESFIMNLIDQIILKKVKFDELNYDNVKFKRQFNEFQYKVNDTAVDRNKSLVILLRATRQLIEFPNPNNYKTNKEMKNSESISVPCCKIGTSEIFSSASTTTKNNPRSSAFGSSNHLSTFESTSSSVIDNIFDKINVTGTPLTHKATETVSKPTESTKISDRQNSEFKLTVRDLVNLVNEIKKSIEVNSKPFIEDPKSTRFSLLSPTTVSVTSSTASLNNSLSAANRGGFSFGLPKPIAAFETPNSVERIKDTEGGTSLSSSEHTSIVGSTLSSEKNNLIVNSKTALAAGNSSSDKPSDSVFGATKSVVELPTSDTCKIMFDHAENLGTSFAKKNPSSGEALKSIFSVPNLACGLSTEKNVTSRDSITTSIFQDSKSTRSPFFGTANISSTAPTTVTNDVIPSLTTSLSSSEHTSTVASALSSEKNNLIVNSKTELAAGNSSSEKPSESVFGATKSVFELPTSDTCKIIIDHVDNSGTSFAEKNPSSGESRKSVFSVPNLSCGLSTEENVKSRDSISTSIFQDSKSTRSPFICTPNIFPTAPTTVTNDVIPSLATSSSSSEHTSIVASALSSEKNNLILNGSSSSPEITNFELRLPRSNAMLINRRFKRAVRRIPRN